MSLQKTKQKKTKKPKGSLIITQIKPHSVFPVISRLPLLQSAKSIKEYALINASCLLSVFSLEDLGTASVVCSCCQNLMSV